MDHLTAAAAGELPAPVAHRVIRDLGDGHAIVTEYRELPHLPTSPVPSDDTDTVADWFAALSVKAAVLAWALSRPARLAVLSAAAQAVRVNARERRSSGPPPRTGELLTRTVVAAPNAPSVRSSPAA